MLILFLLSAMVQGEVPPGQTLRFLDAVERANLAAAKAGLSPDAMIMAEVGEDEAASATIEQFARFVRGCRRSATTAESDAEDPSRVAVTVTWTCPSRASAQAFIWNDPSGIVHVQYGAAPQD